MVSYEIIREMPLEELLHYFNALNAICARYEHELQPLYNAPSQKDRLKWVEINNEYQHAKMYFDIVLNAMKYKAYNGLENYQPEIKKEKKSTSKAKTKTKK